MNTVVLGDIATWGSGGTPSRSVREYFGSGLPWVSIADLDDGPIGSAKESLTPLGIQNSSAKPVPPGTLLVAMYGSIGKLGISTRELCTSQAIAFAIPDKSRVDTRYLFHYLLAQRPRLQAFGRGGTQSNIGQGDLKSWRMPLPPVPEQRRIAEILDQADALRAKRRAALAQLDTLTQSIFLDMFGDPVLNPRGLPIQKMIDLVDAERPISYGILMPGPDQEAGVKYVRVVDMQDGGIELSGIRQTTAAISNAYRRSLLKSGDLLMSIRGHVGRLAVVPPALDKANITQDTARLAIAGAEPVFVRECLRTTGFQRWMARHTKGVAVRGINLGDVKLMPVITPQLSEQKAFVRLAGAADELKIAARATLSELGELFASLQHRAFRGEL